MKFTNARFAEITKLMRALKYSPDASDKRRAARVAIRIPIQIKVPQGKAVGPWKTVELRDVSPRGLRFVFKEPLEVGCSFMTMFPSTSVGRVSSPVVCRVIHCGAQENGSFLIGAEFDGPIRAVQPGVEAVAEEERIRRRILD
jgi:hypothetical protein